MEIHSWKARHLIRRAINTFGYDITRFDNEFGQNGYRDAQNLLKKTDNLILFDVGANIGHTTFRLLEMFPNSAIYSFEPDPELSEQLRRRAAEQPFVSVLQVALGSENGPARLFRTQNRCGNSLLPVASKDAQFGTWAKPDGELPIQVRRLDSFCREHHIEWIDFIKLDTQGYELQILRGGGDFITPIRTKLIYLEVSFVPVYQNQALFEDIYSFLRTRGYRLVDLYGKVRDARSELLYCDALFA